METPQLVVLNLILLMLVFAVNVKVRAVITMDALEGEAHYCAGACDDKIMAGPAQGFDYTDSED
ncbi:MAG: hypothetical protein WBN08_05575 [Thiogranum sp.]